MLNFLIWLIALLVAILVGAILIDIIPGKAGKFLRKVFYESNFGIILGELSVITTRILIVSVWILILVIVTRFLFLFCR